MKKIVIVIASIFLTLSLYSQETLKRDLIIQKTTPQLHLNGFGSVINFYNNDVRIVHSTDQIDILGGRLKVSNNIRIGSQSLFDINRITLSNNKYAVISAGNDTVSPYISSDDLVNGDSVYPNILFGSSAPSSVPNKIGNIYVNTSSKKVYISTGTSSAGDWTELN